MSLVGVCYVQAIFLLFYKLFSIFVSHIPLPSNLYLFIYCSFFVKVIFPIMMLFYSHNDISDNVSK